MIAHVDARTGIGVLVPRSPDAGVLLDDGERDTGLLEPDPRQQTGLTASDHDDREVRAGTLGHRPRRPGVTAVELHLLEQHGHVLVGYRFTYEPLHHFVE